VIQKTIQKKRALTQSWNFQLNQKKTSAELTCAAANKKDTQDRARVEGECKRMMAEVEELSTQIAVENEKINADEKEGMAEITKEETNLESKRTKETIAVEEKADQDTNEINEQQTEKELD
jgi:hypothetical protein